MALIISNLIFLSVFLICALTGIISIDAEDKVIDITDYTTYDQFNDLEPKVVLFPATDVTDPMTIVFSFRTLFGNSSMIDEYHLTTGDGDHRSNLSNIRHGYSHTGIYQVEYWVTFKNGNGSDHRYRILNITGRCNSLPYPHAMLTTYNIKFKDQPILLSGNGSYDIDGNITGYFWIYGDGEHSNRDIFDGFYPGKVTSHTYHGIGKYRALLLVMDDKGFVNRPENATTIIVSISPSKVYYSP
jgi:hypothetical protein